MNSILDHIRRKIGGIQFGILRFQENGLQQSRQVKVALGEKGLLYCVVTGDMPDGVKENCTVHLIQKHKDDYIYITGRIAATAVENKQVLGIRIVKASWFERLSNGSVSSFLEKFVYEGAQHSEMAA